MNMMSTSVLAHRLGMDTTAGRRRIREWVARGLLDPPTDHLGRYAWHEDDYIQAVAVRDAAIARGEYLKRLKAVLPPKAA